MDPNLSTAAKTTPATPPLTLTQHVLELVQTRTIGGVPLPYIDMIVVEPGSVYAGE